jgi:hypothetical protein
MQPRDTSPKWRVPHSVFAVYPPFFDTSALGAFSPATAHTIDNSQNNPTLHQKTTLNLYGVGEGNIDLGAKVARYQSDLNASLLRNLANASVG